MMNKKIKTIIVEDIHLAADSLLGLLHPYQEIEIISVHNNKKEAIENIKKHKPDLLFMDIKIGKDSGLDILNECKNYFKYVIFTTAYSEFVMQSYNYMTVHYLLKPINPIELNTAIQKVKQLTQNNIVESAPEFSDEAKIIYNEKGYWKNIPSSEIIYLESKRSYCNIYTNNGVTQLSKSLLKVLESLGTNHKIIRIHKSYAVNLKYIAQIKRGMNSSVILYNGIELPVSVLHKSNLVKKMGF